MRMVHETTNSNSKDDQRMEQLFRKISKDDQFSYIYIVTSTLQQMTNAKGETPLLTLMGTQLSVLLLFSVYL